MNEYVRFFFGTPKRTLYTGICLFILAILIHPPILTLLFLRFAEAVEPILAPLLNIALILFGIGWIFQAAFPRKKKAAKKD